jgi:hypothetical protein
LDLHTVDDTVFSTYHEAALHLGLFTNESEGYYALLEATISYCTPTQLRFLFSRLILAGYPAVPLWESFVDELTADFSTSLPSFELATNRSLQQISEWVQENGRTLSDFGLPEPHLPSTEVLAELLAYQPHQQALLLTANSKYDQLNFEQKKIHNIIIKCVSLYQNDPLALPPPMFVEGKPGRGKTFLLDTIACFLRSQGSIVLIVGTSALAATLYEGGRTAHNLFKIPVTQVGFLPRS